MKLRVTLLSVVAAESWLATRAVEELSFEPFPRVRIKQFARGVTDHGHGAGRR